MSWDTPGYGPAPTVPHVEKWNDKPPVESHPDPFIYKEPEHDDTFDHIMQYEVLDHIWH